MEDQHHQQGQAQQEQEQTSRWVRGRLLGSGSFGRVHLAIDTTSGESFAVKSASMAAAEPLPPRVASGGCMTALENEISILSRISCEHVVSFRGCDWTREGDRVVRNLHMEHVAGGNVARLVAAMGGLHVNQLRRYTRDLVTGVAHLHAQGIVHGDIKGLNLLITTDDRIKIADFGSSFCDDSATDGDDAATATSAPAEGSLTLRLHGTTNWMAPEVVRGERHSTAEDIWSLGCTVLEMATGRPAWSHVKGGTAAVLYAIGCTDDLPVVPTDLPSVARSFVGCCLRRDASQRWTAQQLLAHPFLQSDDRCETVATAAVACDSNSLAIEVASPKSSILDKSCFATLAPLSPMSPTSPLDAFGLSSPLGTPSPRGPAKPKKRVLGGAGDNAPGSSETALARLVMRRAMAAGLKRRRTDLMGETVPHLVEQSVNDDIMASPGGSSAGSSVQWPRPVLCPPSGDWIVVVSTNRAMV